MKKGRRIGYSAAESVVKYTTSGTYVSGTTLQIDVQPGRSRTHP
jgi:hypothetical protein